MSAGDASPRRLSDYDTLKALGFVAGSASSAVERGRRQVYLHLDLRRRDFRIKRRLYIVSLTKSSQTNTMAVPSSKAVYWTLPCNESRPQSATVAARPLRLRSWSFAGR